ncbi:hypothetical protein IMW75_11160 [Pseudomonas gregormendelii]|uniref:Uncharacterized protein n=1 Tax=Pseudomonas gregormendelii TaxID=1628277 RepID=A0ABS3AG06_9PSED|nr:hypothetical protein [Pseudomonas gregormendelii]MBN3965837.1 hypothetical protein [Pseudomonas gregormendelii]
MSDLDDEPSKAIVAMVSSLAERTNFARVNSAPNLAEPAAVSAILWLIDFASECFDAHFDDQKALALKTGQLVKKSSSQARAMELRLQSVSQRTEGLTAMVERIERAHDAADQLPADLEALAESRRTVADLRNEAEKDRAHVLALREALDKANETMKVQFDEATSILALCESAYSSATSLGLAAAFSERSKKLDWSTWAWVVGLVGALAIGGYVGGQQLESLARLMATPDSSVGIVLLNLMLAGLSVGAPIWFAWLATKQIGQRFRLSEDYAFKASISRAYEGYRREASRVDPELEQQLLRSALSRLDEQPLRLVESASYGSPWHELIASDLVKNAAKSVPGFVEKVTDLASNSLERARNKVGVSSAPAGISGDIPKDT